MSPKQEELSFHESTSAAALITPDGKTVVIEHSLSSGKTLRFGLTVDAASELLHRLSTMLSASMGDAGFVRMTKVSGAHANATEEPGAVALCLVEDGPKVSHYFLMQAATSASLRKELRSAEANAVSAVRLPRA